MLGLGLPGTSHYIPKINRAEVSRYTQESCKYFWELTLQGRDKRWEHSVLPQTPPTRLFSAKIPPQRPRQFRSERRPSSSSAHGDAGQRCWAWHQESASLLSVAAPSRGTAQTSQIPALLPHMLPQLPPTREYVPVLHARSEPKWSPGSAGTHGAQNSGSRRQKQEPSTLQRRACILLCSLQAICLLTPTGWRRERPRCISCCQPPTTYFC